MTVIKRIAPGSAFKLGLVVYGVLGLAFGVIVELVALSRISLPGGSQPTRSVFPFGTAAIVLLPLMYAVVGGVFAALGAVIYNVASKWVGGLQIDIG